MINRWFLYIQCNISYRIAAQTFAHVNWMDLKQKQQNTHHLCCAVVLSIGYAVINCGLIVKQRNIKLLLPG